MIGVQRGQELIGAGEVLESLPVLLDGTKPGIEAGALYAVAPDAVAGRHQHITPSPSVVGNVAGFVGIERRCGAIPLARRRDAINQHVVIEDAALRGQRKPKILRPASREH